MRVSRGGQPARWRGGWLLGAALAPLLWVASCTPVRSTYDYSREPDPRKHEFVIGPSDVLRVSVLHNPDVSVDTTVRPDGTITMPLVGDIKAAGRPVSEVRTEIATKLQRFLKDDGSIVTLAVVSINSYRFVVSGNVEHPGVYGATHYVLISEAVALAGGPNKYASPEQTVLIRPTEGTGPRRIPIDYPGIVAGRFPEQDLVVLPGDQLVVP